MGTGTKEQIRYNLLSTYCIKCGKEIPFVQPRQSKYCLKCKKYKNIK